MTKKARADKPPVLSITSVNQSGRDSLGQLLAEPVAGRVQPALDRADRTLELVAHLLERLSLDVERDQRATIEVAELRQSAPDLLRALVAQQVIERRPRLGLERRERI